ncbi:hypothetical protein H8K35_18250 [Undibacterium sp. LX40W]|uniref:Uncharacterized protein n=1 Tax=Undibacterium nitidum TaxID=2762298 RepID=A0A923HSL6_9BURK|nr:MULTISPECIES: hypothetical protein [Undibacterium]MBC3883341.1 hypothetical protein [Undibacterium nitidum]MBC3893623.1 hypothetical protein [Undibacterium sp. LX40W]
MAFQEIALQLSLNQGNLILEALAERPFKQVFELIGQLNQQASAQFDAHATAEAMGVFVISAGQLRLIIEALGELPYNRVARLLQQLHQQLQEAHERV